MVQIRCTTGRARESGTTELYHSLGPHKIVYRPMGRTCPSVTTELLHCGLSDVISIKKRPEMNFDLSDPVVTQKASSIK